MPGRITPLITEQIYHVFNRGIDKRPTFTSKRECSRAQDAISYYRILKPPVSLSKYLTLDQEKRQRLWEQIKNSPTIVQILCFCLMPNHFHFLLRQNQDGGISKFLSNFQNSYTRYFNTKHERDGSLFMGQFKAVRVETDEQLLHVSRYIHLNPYTNYVVSSLDQLKAYSWSSLPAYLERPMEYVDTSVVLFGSPKKYQQFVYDQADYQRKLDKIKHLILE